jgi:hypothetical protein
MLAWVVIDRRYSGQFPPISSSPRTLCLCDESFDPFPPTSVVPTTYALPVATAAPQPLCNQSVTHSFYLDEGIPPSGAALTTAILSNAYAMFPIFFIFNPVRTLLHFSALPKNSTLLFSSHSALCVKKHSHRAWEGIHQRIAVFFEIRSGQSGQLSPLTARQSRVTGHQSPVTNHQSLPLAALPFARGYRSARIRMETHDT